MYGFYFDKDGETIRLPVNTGNLKVSSGGKNKIVDLIATGEFNILKNPALKDFTFSILLPGIPYHFVHTQNGFQPPSFYEDKFRSYRDDKKPVRFIVTRERNNGEALPPVNLLVSIEDMETEERAGEEGDLWVEMRLKEYREVMVVKQTVVAEDNGTPVVEETPQRPAKDPPQEYTVVEGDCLWSIAKRLLGDGSRYQEIADLNGIKNPNLIYPGQVFKMPEK
jgi:hypothetical protein